jgi:hypothetical protein
MRAVADKNTASKYVNSCATPAWDRIIGFCRGFYITLPGISLRDDQLPSGSSSTRDSEDDDGENERSEETPIRSPAETSKAGQERPPARLKAGKRTHPRSSPEPVVGESNPMSRYL